jgi:hypothetical protein
MKAKCTIAKSYNPGQKGRKIKAEKWRQKNE